MPVNKVQGDKKEKKRVNNEKNTQCVIINLVQLLH